MSQYFEFDTDEDFIDKAWYLNVKNKQKLHMQNNCEHANWVKKCSCCGKILDSDVLEKQRNEFAAKIIVTFKEKENDIIDVDDTNHTTEKGVSTQIPASMGKEEQLFCSEKTQQAQP